MKGRLLLSTTALLAGVALANAQSTPQPERGAGTQSPNASQSQMSQPGGGEAQRGQAQIQKQQSPSQRQSEGMAGKTQDQDRGRSETTGQAPSDREQIGQKQQPGSQGRTGAERDQRQQDRTSGQAPQRQQRQQDQAGQQKQQDRDMQRGAQQQKQQKQRTEGRAGDTSERRAGTAGRDRARGGVDLTVQQRTRIRQTVLARSNVPRINDVDFALSIGTVVPSHVHFVAVPPVLVDIHPEWRGHRYFVVEEDIVIVSPDSREIVAVVPLGSSQASVGGGAVGGAVAVDLSEAEIRQVQTVLIERGFLDGDADGIFGPRTRSALITFQRSEGLEATGRITTRTVTALNLSDRITVRDEQRGGREPSTVGRGNERMQQQPSGRRDMNRDMDNERRGERRGDMNNERRGEMDSNKMDSNMPQDRATTGQGDRPNADRRGEMNTQPRNRSTTGQGGDQSRGEQNMGSSTTGQGNDRPSGRSSDSPNESPNASSSPSSSGGAGR